MKFLAYQRFNKYAIYERAGLIKCNKYVLVHLHWNVTTLRWSISISQIIQSFHKHNYHTTNNPKFYTAYSIFKLWWYKQVSHTDTGHMTTVVKADSYDLIRPYGSMQNNNNHHDIHKFGKENKYQLKIICQVLCNWFGTAKRRFRLQGYDTVLWGKMHSIS